MTRYKEHLVGIGSADTKYVPSSDPSGTRCGSEASMGLSHHEKNKRHMDGENIVKSSQSHTYPRKDHKRDVQTGLRNEWSS
ncbi:unnamed protein product [Cylicostephanus goldi]|uniref:Uncharacterized protein n=1 Tax=Cylicostephanus goldi TaxID=71465 RepID=A0A3P6QYH9_CYLGO|nr:unnamed protein product [Cylicostephanus goldi]